MRMKMKHHWTAFAAMAGIFTVGCDPFGSFCEEWASCENKSDQEQEICVLEANAEEDRASVKGCSDQFDARVDCLSEHSECDENHKYGTPECTDQDDAYTDCMEPESG